MLEAYAEITAAILQTAIMQVRYLEKKLLAAYADITPPPTTPLLQLAIIQVRYREKILPLAVYADIITPTSILQLAIIKA
jgi:hypothetical protein